jgi:hypothetical protein
MDRRGRTGMTIAVIWLLAEMGAPWYMYIFVAIGFILKMAVLAGKGEKE